MVVLLNDAELEKMYAKPLGQSMACNLPRICAWLLLWNEYLRPWRKESQTGHQSMDLFQSIQSQSVSRLKKRPQIWDIVIIVHKRGKKFIFPRFCLIAPERKHFHCVVMIRNTCEPHPT